MLPSSGYFKSVPCPFYKNGLCERLHCHFGHTKSDTPPGKSWTSRAFPEVNKDVLDIFVDSDKSTRTPAYEPPSFSYSSAPYPNEEVGGGGNAYIPTPVDKPFCPPATSSILKKNRSSSSIIPEYRPTPISRLNPYDSGEENSWDSSNLPRKKKKVEEYDPIAFKYVFKKSKRVSFNLPDDQRKNSESSDEEPSYINPQFSDDESEGHLSDDTYASIINIKKGKLGSADTDNNASQEQNKESEAEQSEVSNFSVVDQILVDVKKNEDLSDVHKPCSKPTSDSKLKAQKNNSKSKDKERSGNHEKTKKHSENEKHESSKESTTLRKLKDDKNGQQFSRVLGGKKDSSTLKDSTGNKITQGKPLDSSNKISKKSSSEHGKNENKGLKHSGTHKEGENEKLPKTKVKSRDTDKKVGEDSNTSKKNSVADKLSVPNKKGHETIKHGDSIKSKNSTNNSKDQSKNSTNSSKDQSRSSSKSKTSKTHDSDSAKAGKRKESVKIQDEKVSSSCHASNKKNASSPDKILSTSPSKKKVKLKHDGGETKKSSKESIVPKSDLKKKTSEKVLRDVRESLHDLQSPIHVPSDSDADSDMDSYTVYEECLRIFNENAQPPVQKDDFSKRIKDDEKEAILTQGKGKKRVAHQMSSLTQKVPKELPQQQLNPSQVMHNRYLQLQDMYTRQTVPDVKKIPSSFVSSASKGSEIHKRRITIPANSDLVAAVTEKQKALQSGSPQKPCPHGITYVVTEIKRVSHIPTQVVKPRPIIPVEYGSKVPSNVRQRYLNNFIDECQKFCSNEEEAYQMALEEEKRAYDRSSNKTVYLNVAVNTLKRLRNQAMEEQSTRSDVQPSSTLPEHSTAGFEVKMGGRTISHEMMLGGARAQKTSYSIERKKPKMQDFEIKGNMLYDSLMSYSLNNEQLVEHGFPLPHPVETGRAVISGVYANRKSICNDPVKRVCNRCQKPYEVNEYGNFVKIEECEYHWGHLWQKRVGRSMEGQYSCCGGDRQSDGCCVATGHVFDGTQSDILKGYVKTMPKSPPPDGYCGVYALDCEMCYTSGGLELIRVTVINPDMKAVYETFVKPENPVVDFNTRFSGITEENLIGVQTSIRDVQAVLLCLFNDKTILIGHSLESDFKALKLIHTTVVDTSVVFPHKRGLPYKRALRTLMAEYMRKIIQNSLDGHDSNEDAMACMELMLWKVKEDLKKSSRLLI